jgi:hypothetical protein
MIFRTAVLTEMEESLFIRMRRRFGSKTRGDNDPEGAAPPPFEFAATTELGFNTTDAETFATLQKCRNLWLIVYAGPPSAVLTGFSEFFHICTPYSYNFTIRLNVEHAIIWHMTHPRALLDMNGSVLGINQTVA